MLTDFRISFTVLTPLYLGGASQDAELRPPSIKGVLRYWWRTLHPVGAKELQEKEARVFGGAGFGQGQAPFFLTMDRPMAGSSSWDRSLVQRFSTKGDKGLPLNGLQYLGYPFPLNDNQQKKRNKDPRKCIPPEERFDLTFIFPSDPEKEICRELCAAIWLLGHLGGAGSRSRRGFGALALERWPSDGAGWEEMSRLPVLHNTRTPEEWLTSFAQVRQTLEEWFGKESTDIPHPHFGKETKPVVGTNGYSTQDWAACLNEMGISMQRFRQKMEPDYSMVKASLGGRGLLQRTPGRASFGLPLAFRFGPREINLVSRDGNRHGSLLHLRPVLIGGRLHPLYLRLAGAVPGQSPPAKDEKFRDALPPLEDNAMDRFIEQLQGVIRHG